MKFDIALRLTEYGLGIGVCISFILISLNVVLPSFIRGIREAWNEPMEWEDDGEGDLLK